MSQNDIIVGIDLGTTNSEIAAYVGDRVRVLGAGDSRMLPSCVGLSPEGELLVGGPARNQQLVYPERTVRSIKRKMGTDEKARLGDKDFTPQEISSFILRALVEQAEHELGEKVDKAVITIPAYFSDAQRQATREAGDLAGLEVLRILNEPTAASLAYGHDDREPRTVLVYDLGGGTFDVSIVHIEGDVTEVLASHGNNHLGGDDFDQLLVDRLSGELASGYGIDLRKDHRLAYSRLWWAVEEARKKLSFDPYVKIREESLFTVNQEYIHLDREISREDFEQMIRPLVESTLESVSKALTDSGKKPSDLDAVLLVGGATRTPLVSSILEERIGIVPHQEVHPDLCVALGAGVLATRLAGREVERVLVDVSPYSFGPSYLGERGGVPYPHCYRPIIQRNTPLPVTRSDSYYTAASHQKAVEIHIYQGDDPDALNNILVGNFTVEGLTPVEEPNEVLCRMSLDLDGILRVTAIEKRTGKSKQIIITEALRPKSDEEIAEARKRLEALYSARSFDRHGLFVDDEGGWLEQDEGENEDALPEEEEDETGAADADEDATAPERAGAIEEARRLLARSRSLLDRMHDEDKEEAIELNEAIESAMTKPDTEALSKALHDLKELLFFVEGR